jgi:hypothetical protein
VGPRHGLDAVVRINVLTLPGLELRPLSRSGRSQSLYRVRYPGSMTQSAAQNKEHQSVRRRNAAGVIGQEHNESTRQ